MKGTKVAAKDTDFNYYATVTATDESTSMFFALLKANSKTNNFDTV